MTNQQKNFKESRQWGIICNHKMRGAHIQVVPNDDDGYVHVVACFGDGEERFLFRLTEQEASPYKEAL